MRILIETSVLVEGSVFWEYSNEEKGKKFPFKPKRFDRCDMLFKFLKSNIEHEIGIITKTVEDEAKGVLDFVVERVLKHYLHRGVPDFMKKFNVMTFQDTVTNESLDRMETIIEECSIRPPIDIKARGKIIEDELKPFFEEIVPTTFRFKQPHLPRFIHGERDRTELGEMMLESLPTRGTIYKGMPEERDLRIMAEATFLARKYKEKIQVASLDNHFKPNPVPLYSYLSPMRRYTGEVDFTVRDTLEEKFNFRGDDPTKVLEEVMR